MIRAGNSNSRYLGQRILIDERAGIVCFAVGYHSSCVGQDQVDPVWYQEQLDRATEWVYLD